MIWNDIGINTNGDIWKLLYVIWALINIEIVIRNLRQFWNITSGIYAKYHVQIMLLFVYTTTRKRFVIFTCRYFKLSWNTTALSQSNWRNFSCSRITTEIFYKRKYKMDSSTEQWNDAIVKIGYWIVSRPKFKERKKELDVWVNVRPTRKSRIALGNSTSVVLP